MNRVSHKYFVSAELLQKLEDYVEENSDITIEELKQEFKRLRLFYRCGLAKINQR